MSERPSAPSRSWPVRIGWLIVLWAGGVIAFAALAALLRILMRVAGLSG